MLGFAEHPEFELLPQSKVDPELTSCTRADVVSRREKRLGSRGGHVAFRRVKEELSHSQVSYHLCCDGGIMESHRRIKSLVW